MQGAMTAVATRLRRKGRDVRSSRHARRPGKSGGTRPLRR